MRMFKLQMPGIPSPLLGIENKRMRAYRRPIKISLFKVGEDYIVPKDFVSYQAIAKYIKELHKHLNDGGRPLSRKTVYAGIDISNELIDEVLKSKKKYGLEKIVK